ncbi:MAG: hypothetical protein ACI9J3_000094 [Parvicellaceae bacterium]|jgi:hypothetical protein
MDKRISIGLIFISFLLMFYSCGIKVSNPGKSRYTNHHGMSMNRGGADRNEAPISEGKVSDFQGDLHIKRRSKQGPPKR